MMHWIIWLAISTFINTFIITTIVNVVLMGPLMPRISRRNDENIFLAESLEELVNCSEETYNRKISNGDFRALWNTAMLKMPLYPHIFYCIEKR